MDKGVLGRKHKNDNAIGQCDIKEGAQLHGAVITSKLTTPTKEEETTINAQTGCGLYSIIVQFKFTGEYHRYIRIIQRARVSSLFRPSSLVLLYYVIHKQLIFNLFSQSPPVCTIIAPFFAVVTMEVTKWQ